MATKKPKAPKVIPVLDVSYSDKDGRVMVTDPANEDGEVCALAVREMAPTAPEPVIKGFIRYIAGAFRDTIAAAQKGKKDATAAVVALLASVANGTMQFRERGGAGSLSTEQEFEIIAGVLISLGVCSTQEEGLKWCADKYAVTKTVNTPAKGVEGQDGYKAAKTSVTHPDYNELKRVTAIRDALEAAEKVDPLDELAAIGIKKAA